MKEFKNTKAIIFIATLLLTGYCLLPIAVFAQHNTQLWGMTASGGTENMGTIFHYTPASSTHTVDFSFPVTNPGGYPVYTELTADGNGKFYGMTQKGGTHDQGVIFQWDPNTNSYLKKFDFDEMNTGAYPMGSLIRLGGKFYGMTQAGGTHDYGVIFEWDTTTNSFTKKFDFDDLNSGSYPNGSFTLAGGKLYGMTSSGGSSGVGVIFQWDPATNIFLKKFDLDAAVTGGYSDGSLTLAGGKFYGMTNAGGPNGYGILFQWDTAANTVTDKFDFDDAVTGAYPQGSLTLLGNKLYGMTTRGGTNELGVIFEWNTTTNTFTKKIDFELTSKGGNPSGSLTLAGGKFYGTAFTGGLNSYGVIFEWDTTGNTFTKKFDFDRTTTGSFPGGTLTLYGNKFYGMTNEGGPQDNGVIFEWDTSTNTVTKKIGFNEYNKGANPYGSLALFGGKMYGTTNFGGVNSTGTIFEWDPVTQTQFKRFDFDNTTTGGYPYGSLTLSGGKFYGMTNAGGLHNFGVIFEWDPSANIYIRKFDFNGPSSGGHPDGDLILVGGKLYGMTFDGGTNGFGTIFEWDPSTNTFTKKIDFNGANKGSSPFGSLTSVGGKLYGMTQQGGAHDDGIIFEWNPATNAFIKKFDFDTVNSGGIFPQGSLVMRSGKLYGMTSQGGADASGIIFEWDTATNTFTKKIDFDDTYKGSYPFGSLTLSGGKFYGMTNSGGANGEGVIFEWDPSTNAFTNEVDFNSANGAYPNYTRLVETTSNQLPVLSNLPAAQSNCSVTASSVTFTITDADNDSISFTTGSSNTTLLPNANISVSNISGNNYSVNYTPAPAQTGTVTVTVTADDGYGGTVSFNFGLNINFPPTINAGADVSICNGNAVVLTASGGVSYSWSNAATTSSISVTPTASSIYIVIGTAANNCSASDSVSVTVKPLPLVAFQPFSPDTVCVNVTSLTLTGGFPSGGIYSGTAVSAGQFAPFLAGTGSYMITYAYSGANGCSDSASQTIYVSTCAGVAEQNNNVSVVIFPNPFSTSAEIHLSGISDLSGTEIKLFSLLGEELFSQAITNPELTINRNNFQQGVYFYRIVSRGEILKNGKLIVE